MKNFHGLDRARGYGLKSMAIQAKLTAIAVNLKRIASILSSQISFLSVIFTIFYKSQLKSGIITRITLKKEDFFSGLERFARFPFKYDVRRNTQIFAAWRCDNPFFKIKKLHPLSILLYSFLY